MLEISDLSFLRGQDPVLSHLDLRVGSGELIVVRGANGCGKTTLLKLIAGLLRAEDGSAFRFETTVSDPRSPDFHRELMYVGHQLGIKLDLTSLENLRYFDAFLGDGRSSPRQALEAVGLSGYGHTIALRLSAGQKKRLALARLLLNGRRLWLLDEPYSNLDQQGIDLVDSLLVAHLAAGGAAVITSHGTFVPQVSGFREVHL